MRSDRPDPAGPPAPASPPPTSPSISPSARRPARPPLSASLVVSTAVLYVERWGLPALSMRHLGEALGVEAMSLYRYVAGREELLDAMVDHLVDQVSSDTQVLDTPYNGWQDFVQRLAHGVRDVARAYPHTFPLVASRPPEAPWLRPPLRSVEWVEMFLNGLLDEGFDDQGAVGAYRAFSSFLLGHLLLEVSILGADVGPLDPLTAGPGGPPDSQGRSDLDELPAISRLQGELSLDRSKVEFEESLENLLGRIALMRSPDRR